MDLQVKMKSCLILEPVKTIHFFAFTFLRRPTFDVYALCLHLKSHYFNLCFKSLVSSLTVTFLHTPMRKDARDSAGPTQVTQRHLSISRSTNSHVCSTFVAVLGSTSTGLRDQDGGICGSHCSIYHNSYSPVSIFKHKMHL